MKPADEAFLASVYASTRREELARIDWSRKQIDDFLDMQFQAQHRYYQEQWPETNFDIVLFEGIPVGRLYLDRRVDEFRIVDIALLPEYRGRGIGSSLLKDVLNEAQAAAKVVRIHVEKNNPALGLYRRLGFTQIGDAGVYLLMEWKA